MFMWQTKVRLHGRIFNAENAKTQATVARLRLPWFLGQGDQKIGKTPNVWKK